MTPHIKAIVEGVLELSSRLRHVEGILEGLQAQAHENAMLLAHLKRMSEHTLRLLRQKEVLLEAYGRLALELRIEGAASAEFTADIERARREMGQH